MKINFLLTAIITATLASCSTSYKTGQTPDDVYYSPVRLQNHEVKREDDNRVNDNSTVYDSPIYTPSEDREIRRRINSRRYRRNYDRYNYPYGYNNYPPVYGNPKTGTTTKTQQPRSTNLGGYSSNTIRLDSTNYNPKTGKYNTIIITSPVRTFGTPKTSSNNGSGVGNAIRRIFSGDNSSNNSSSNNSYNNGNSNNSSSSRTFESRSNNTPSSSNNSSTSSSSSSSSSSTSAPVRTFKKD